MTVRFLDPSGYNSLVYFNFLGFYMNFNRLKV